MLQKQKEAISHSVRFDSFRGNIFFTKKSKWGVPLLFNSASAAVPLPGKLGDSAMDCRQRTFRILLRAATATEVISCSSPLLLEPLRTKAGTSVPSQLRRNADPRDESFRQTLRKQVNQNYDSKKKNPTFFLFPFPTPTTFLMRENKGVARFLRKSIIKSSSKTTSLLRLRAQRR